MRLPVGQKVHFLKRALGRHQVWCAQLRVVAVAVSRQAPQPRDAPRFAMGPRAPRKRTIEDVNSDSHKFLSAYYSNRGIPESPDDDAALLRECLGRAESARESFKRWRATPGKEGDDGEDGGGGVAGGVGADGKMSAKAKYMKRLANNRKSADAARVFQEVLRREHTHALREVSRQRDALHDDIGTLREDLRRAREENARLRGVCSPDSIPDGGSCSLADADDDAKDAAAKLCMLGSQPLDSEETASDSDVDGKPRPPPVRRRRGARPALDVGAVGASLLPLESQERDGCGGGGGGISRGGRLARRVPGDPLVPGAFGSQSQGDGGFLAGLAAAAPARAEEDDLPDASELFTGSQGVGNSQGFASQLGASQQAPS